MHGTRAAVNAGLVAPALPPPPSALPPPKREPPAHGAGEAQLAKKAKVKLAKEAFKPGNENKVGGCAWDACGQK